MAAKKKTAKKSSSTRATKKPIKKSSAKRATSAKVTKSTKSSAKKTGGKKGRSVRIQMKNPFRNTWFLFVAGILLGGIIAIIASGSVLDLEPEISSLEAQRVVTGFLDDNRAFLGFPEGLTYAIQNTREVDDYYEVRLVLTLNGQTQPLIVTVTKDGDYVAFAPLLEVGTPLDQQQVGQ